MNDKQCKLMQMYIRASDNRLQYTMWLYECQTVENNVYWKIRQQTTMYNMKTRQYSAILKHAKNFRKETTIYIGLYEGQTTDNEVQQEVLGKEKKEVQCVLKDHTLNNSVQ